MMSALLSQLLLAAASNAGAPTAAPSVCVEAAAAAAIDIAASTVTHSNLGGYGPDSGDETLVFSNAGTTPDGTDFDISIAADSGYAVNNANANGIGNKVFGKINILTNSSGVSSAFTFSLVDSATQQPVVLDEFAFSVYDFDMGASNNAEFAIASGYDYHKLESTTEIAVEAEADGRTRFSATEVGTGSDNPTSATITRLSQ